MDQKTSTENVFEGAPTSSVVSDQRREYTAPVFECLGSLTELTMGFGSRAPDSLEGNES